MDELLAGLDGAALEELLTPVEGAAADIGLPRFTASYEDRALGHAASARHDGRLRGGSRGLLAHGSLRQGPLYVGSVLHKTFIDVNEEGTRAAAATTVSMTGRRPQRTHRAPRGHSRPALCLSHRGPSHRHAALHRHLHGRGIGCASAPGTMMREVPAAAVRALVDKDLGRVLAARAALRRLPGIDARLVALLAPARPELPLVHRNLPSPLGNIMRRWRCNGQGGEGHDRQKDQAHREVHAARDGRARRLGSTSWPSRRRARRPMPRTWPRTSSAACSRTAPRSRATSTCAPGFCASRSTAARALARAVATPRGERRRAQQAAGPGRARERTRPSRSCAPTRSGRRSRPCPRSSAWWRCSTTWRSTRPGRSPASWAARGDGAHASAPGAPKQMRETLESPASPAEEGHYGQAHALSSSARGTQGHAARGRARVRTGRDQSREGRARPRPAQASPRAAGRHAASLRARQEPWRLARSGVSWRKRPHEPPVRREGQLVCAHRLRGGHRGGERLAAGTRQDVRRAHQLERRRGPRGHRRRPDDDLHRSQPHLYGRQTWTPSRTASRATTSSPRRAPPRRTRSTRSPASGSSGRPRTGPARSRAARRELHRRLREPAPQRAP